MENRFVFWNFPFVNEKYVKNLLEPGISKLKKVVFAKKTYSNSKTPFVLWDNTLCLLLHQCDVMGIVKILLFQKSETIWVYKDAIKIIKDECVLICEYHLENAVRLLREKLENFSLFGNLTRASEKDSAFLLGNISEETYNNEDTDWTKSLIRIKRK